IALHRAIARKITENPSLVQNVQQRIDKQLGRGDAHSTSTRYWLRRWKDLIATRSVDQLCVLLVSPSEEMIQMRRSTPFDDLPKWRTNGRISCLERVIDAEIWHTLSAKCR